MAWGRQLVAGGDKAKAEGVRENERMDPKGKGKDDEVRPVNVLATGGFDKVCRLSSSLYLWPSC